MKRLVATAAVMTILGGGCGGQELIVAEDTQEGSESGGQSDLAVSQSGAAAQRVIAVGSGWTSGGIFAAGEFSTEVDSGAATYASRGGTDVFLASYDNAGGLQAFVPIGGSSNDIALDVAADSAGANAYLAAETQGGSVDVCGSTLTDDDGVVNNLVWIARYDASGQCVKVLHLEPDPDGDLDVTGLAVDGSGNVIAVGTFIGALHVGNTDSLVSRRWPAMHSRTLFVAKFDAALALQWVRVYGEDTFSTTSQLQAVLDVAADAAGNILLTGWFRSRIRFGSTWYAALGTRSAYIAKLHSDGVHSWTRVFGTNAYGRKIGVDPDLGRIVVGGSFRDSLELAGESFDNDGATADLFVAKFFAGGTAAYASRMTGTATKYMRGVGIEHNGFAYVTGWFDDGTFKMNDATPVSATAPKMFVAAYHASSSGTRWIRYFSGERPNALVMGVHGERYPEPPIVGGDYFGTLAFGDGSTFTSNSYDGFVARFIP